MYSRSLLDLDESELESTLSPLRPQFNPLNVLAEVAGNIRGSAGRGAQLVDGSAKSSAAEFNVGAAGVSMPLEADGGQSCRSRLPETGSVSTSARQDAMETNSRRSTAKMEQLVDGSANSPAAEFNVGAAGVSMPLEADGGRSCRSRRPEMSSVHSAWSPLRRNRSAEKSVRDGRSNRSDRKSRGTRHRSRGRSSDSASSDDDLVRSVDRREDERLPRARDDDDGRETASRGRSRNYLTLAAGVKLGTFDGQTALETFLARFENCSQYLNWNEADRLYHLKASLVGPAGQLLWDGPQTTTVAKIVSAVAQPVW
jgi:hypothetical protein